MRRLIFALLAFTVVGGASPALAKSRIKDIVEFEGVRGNALTGIGLVVGLNGTGDNLRNCPGTRQMLESSSERLGVNIRDSNLNSKNAAMVSVSATLPAFAAAGSKMDITVSSACDAKSLLGATLLPTTLIGADGNAYATGQGTVQTGSISAGGASGSSVTKGVPTAGRIAGGGVIENETKFQLASMGQMRLTLRNPDMTTATRIAQVINAKVSGGIASVENGTIILLSPPAGQNMAGLISSIEQLEVEPDNAAKVVIDEVAGVIVMGDAVRISTVAIQQGNLTISVQETPSVSQPNALSRGGDTAVVPQSNVSVEEETGKQFIQLKQGATLGNLVAGLNALGVTTRDLISILQSIKAQGALQADIEVM